MFLKKGLVMYKLLRLWSTFKLNLWLTAPKGATPVNQTSATDWQITVRRDNVISTTLRQVFLKVLDV